MTRIREWIARLLGPFRGTHADAEMREEMLAHLEMETAEHVRRGLSPDEARRRALLASGGLTQAAEAVRDQRGLPWLEGVASDMRYAARALRRSPVFTTVVVLTLALGIGANTAIFSVVRAVLLRPLPHRDGDRLLYLRQASDGPGRDNLRFSVPEVGDLRQGVPALGGIAEYSPWSGILQQPDGVVRLHVGLVTGNYFDVMGLSPVLGRVTRPSDDGPGVPPVMVLTYELWQRRFGGDSGVIGRQVTLDGKSVTVIGVLQPAPFFPDRVDGMLNMVFSSHHLSAMMVQGRTHRMTEVVARLAPGASVQDARVQVATVYARLQHDHTDAYDPGSHYRVAVLPFKEAIGADAKLTLWLLMGAAAFVLIIAAANVANLTLMRGVRREHELVTRAALGAGVARLRRMLLVENLLLTFMGAAAGLVLAVGGLRMLVALADRYSPRAGEIRLDSAVLAFTLLVSVVVALLLSWIATLPREGNFASWIAAGGHRMSGGLRKLRLQRALVVAQVAVSVVLLAGAGLLTRTMLRLSAVDTGLETESVLTMSVPLLTMTQLVSDPKADVGAKVDYERMRTQIASLPGVVEVGLGGVGPLRSSDVRFDVRTEGTEVAPGAPMPNAEMRPASPEYFHASGIPLLKGRAFEATDRAGAALVVIINQSLANELFPNGDAVGKRVAWTGDVLRFTPISGDWRTVVGVVGDTRDGGLDAVPRTVMFMPFAQMLAMSGWIVIRTDSNASALITPATRIVRSIAPTAPIENVTTIAQVKDQSVAPRRLNAELIASFGILAVIIAAVGIAGVLAFSVSARTHEIGIRMSLGADAARVERMILSEGGALLGLGLALGVAGAYFATEILRGLLFGVAPHDPMTFIVVALLMGAIGLAACWIPALRASRIDPAITMRSV